MLSGLVVAEAKSPCVVLKKQVYQAVVEMYGYAKALALAPSLVCTPKRLTFHRRDVIRGAVTTGDRWIFLILVMNPDGDGAKYWLSGQFSILSGYSMPSTRAVITSPIPDVVAGILTRWVGLSSVIGLPLWSC